MSIVNIAQKLSSGSLLTNEIVVILITAIRGGGNDISDKEMNKIVWDSGLVEAMTVCGAILTNALSGGSGKSQEASE